MLIMTQVNELRNHISKDYHLGLGFAYRGGEQSIYSVKVVSLLQEIHRTCTTTCRMGEVCLMNTETGVFINNYTQSRLSGMYQALA